MDNEFPDSDEEYDLIHKDDFEVLQEIQGISFITYLFVIKIFL